MEKRNIKINSELHIYTDEFDDIYLSVSRVLAIFTPEFPTAMMARQVAKKRGVKTSVVLEEWKQTNKKACDDGHDDHSTIESIKEIADSDLHPKLTPVKRLIEGLELAGKGIHHERIVYHPEHYVAGTIDLLVMMAENYFAIYDWKTNKDNLNFTSGYYKKDSNGVKTDKWVKKDDRMLGPLSHLQHCKGVIYTLQLSLYAYLMECWGYENKYLKLFHIRDKEGTEEYKLEYLRDEAIIMLDFVDNNRRDLFPSHHKLNQLTTI